MRTLAGARLQKKCESDKKKGKKKRKRMREQKRDERKKGGREGEKERKGDSTQSQFLVQYY